MFNTYGYTDFHELNLDWILRKIYELEKDYDTFKALNTITFGGSWDITKAYKQFTIVESNGMGYISIDNVNAGTLLTDETKWRLVANYSELFADFQNRLRALEVAPPKGELHTEYEMVCKFDRGNATSQGSLVYSDIGVVIVALNTADNNVALVKYNYLTGSELQRVSSLGIGHGNSIAKSLTSNNFFVVGDYNRKVYEVDFDSLNIVATHDIEASYTIASDTDRNCYWLKSSTVAGGLYKYDSNFNKLGDYVIDIPLTGQSLQGMAYSDNKLYNMYADSNTIQIIDVETMKTLNTVTFPEWCYGIPSGEFEDITINGDDIYISLNYYGNKVTNVGYLIHCNLYKGVNIHSFTGGVNVNASGNFMLADGSESRPFTTINEALIFACHMPTIEGFYINCTGTGNVGAINSDFNITKSGIIEFNNTPCGQINFYGSNANLSIRNSDIYTSEESAILIRRSSYISFVNCKISQVAPNSANVIGIDDSVVSFRGITNTTGRTHYWSNSSNVICDDSAFFNDISNNGSMLQSSMAIDYTVVSSGSITDYCLNHYTKGIHSIVCTGGIDFTTDFDARWSNILFICDGYNRGKMLILGIGNNIITVNLNDKRVNEIKHLV